ncbi:hypothetical protein A2Z00_01880 [Candidatus Gottesmanbacteria bacterium RBG_13_45_10]|uniref:Uncharacterized protein n=1 Tax=Candidatus Gottesmanbacteria bacterium RBG_13_45_10 TaxID=1798370 RepID=A0A1F5ZI62_9BACT|nr:MAG: hypothetical protein A2Z00_01880 [Candidatus Gottesmanbacteria bacterium RBG_13_45_10]
MTPDQFLQSPDAMNAVYRQMARQAAERFRHYGWKVVDVEQKGMVLPLVIGKGPLSVICGDGRYARYFQNHKELNPQCTISIFGGAYGAQALRFGGTLEGLRTLAEYANKNGLVFRTHGDEHGEHHEPADFNCGFLGKWAERKLRGVMPLEIPKQEFPDMLAHAQTLGFGHDILPGVHEERVLVLNFAPGTTVAPQATRFRVDGWVAGSYLGLTNLVDVSRQTVELLKKDVRAVTIVNP